MEIISETADKLIPALIAAQSAIKGAVKDSTNGHYGSKYADLASIWEACREPLHSNNLAVVQLPIPSEKQNHLALKTILIHASGQWIASVLEAPLPKPDPQGVGSAITYFRRYALAAMLQIPQIDDDGTAVSLVEINGRQHVKTDRGYELTKAEQETVNSKIVDFRSTREQFGLTIKQAEAIVGQPLSNINTIEGWNAAIDALVQNQYKKEGIPA